MSNSSSAAAVATAVEQVPSTRPVSDAQLNANRANAQKSSGPVTSEGKAKVALNALKTGLTGQTVLLAGDDYAAYQAHIERNYKDFAPADDRERTVVQFLADTEWRLLRIAPLEAAIWAKGQRDFADQFASEANPSVREGLIKLETMTAYSKDLRNLALQERRLRNQYKEDLKNLHALQSTRWEMQAAEDRRLLAQMQQAQKLSHELQRENKPFNTADFGFEFSTEEFNVYWAEVKRAQMSARPVSSVRLILKAYRSVQKERKAA